MKKLEFLLQIKKWKLFCLFISPFLLSWIPFVETYISPLILIIWFAWVVSIGYNGQDYLRAVKINWLTKKKLILRVYYVLALFIISIFLPKQNDNDADTFFFIIVPLIIIGVYCIYYIFIATAVIITTIEHRRKAEFWTTFGHFIRLFFFPLGVYGIQEILNREFAELY